MQILFSFAICARNEEFIIKRRTPRSVPRKENDIVLLRCTYFLDHNPCSCTCKAYNDKGEINRPTFTCRQYTVHALLIIPNYIYISSKAPVSGQRCPDCDLPWFHTCDVIIAPFQLNSLQFYVHCTRILGYGTYPIYLVLCVCKHTNRTVLTQGMGGYGFQQCDKGDKL